MFHVINTSMKIGKKCPNFFDFFVNEWLKLLSKQLKMSFKSLSLFNHLSKILGIDSILKNGSCYNYWSFILDIGVVHTEEVEWRDSNSEISIPCVYPESFPVIWAPSMVGVSCLMMDPLPKLNMGLLHPFYKKYVSLSPLLYYQIW